MAEVSSKNLQESARKVLADCFLLRGLSEQQRTSLTARARIRAFAKGETIFRMSDNGDCLVAVLAGRVRISVASPDGREMALAILGPGEIVGEIAVLDGKERTADATALDPCTLAILDRREVLSSLERDPGAWLRIVEILCARLRNTDQHIAEITLLDVPSRLASALLRLVEHGEPTRRQVKVSQRELGQLVGATRESVNKCLAEWQRSGVVRVQGTLITVADRMALEQIAQPD